MKSRYEQACEDIAAMRGDHSKSPEVFVRATLDNRNAIYPATYITRLPSGYVRVRVVSMGRTFVINTDARNVAASRHLLQNKGEWL